MSPFLYVRCDVGKLLYDNQFQGWSIWSSKIVLLEFKRNEPAVPPDNRRSL